MTLLVFGGEGQLGRALTRAGGDGVRGCGRAEADITRPAEVVAAFDRHRPTLVVNAAAHTGVDQAESEPERAFAVNADGPAVLAEACRVHGLPLIHLSTDYVFDGTAHRPYREDDPTAPLGVYGRSKLAGEQAVRAGLDAHLILRTAWVVSPGGRNFVLTMLRLARERAEVGVVTDQRGSPTSAAALAAAILLLAARLKAGAGGFGTFHFTGGGATTWHDFAAHIFRRAAERGLTVPVLKPLTSAQFPTPARRPAWSVLDCSRILAVHGIAQTPWTVLVDACLEEIWSG